MLFAIENLIFVTYQCCAHTELQNWFEFINAKFNWWWHIFVCMCDYLFPVPNEFIFSACFFCVLLHLHTGLFINGATSRTLPKKQQQQRLLWLTSTYRLILHAIPQCPWTVWSKKLLKEIQDEEIEDKIKSTTLISLCNSILDLCKIQLNRWTKQVLWIGNISFYDLDETIFPITDPTKQDERFTTFVWLYNHNRFS